MEIIKQGNLGVLDRLYEGVCKNCQAVIRLKEKESTVRIANISGKVQYVEAACPCCDVTFFAFPYTPKEICDTIRAS